MPLLARLRHLFDLDAEPTVIDAHLEQGGLAALVADRPGLRIPGAFDGFEVALALLVRSGSRSNTSAREAMRRVVQVLGAPIETGDPALTHLAPDATRVAEAGISTLAMAGVAEQTANAIVRVATMIVEGSLHLEPGSDVNATHRALLNVDGVTGVTAAAIIARALQWPDAFAASDGRLRRAAGARSISELVARAEAWRPWRAYAAMHLLLAPRHGEYRRDQLRW
jgi:AraC family transcriptional regulator of adaptative response / DNA-3-methyladenine glycosylase II